MAAAAERLLALAGRVARPTCWRRWPRSPTATATAALWSTTRGVIDLRDGRHPVVEQLAAAGSFVPNDVRLDPDAEQILIVTRPNMAGKSTLIRQVALAVIHGADGRLRAGAPRAHGPVRPRVHARRRGRQPGPRRVDLHGRDARDRAHPPPRDRRAAWSCSTRSDAAPPPTTACPSRGRWPNTYTTAWAHGPCSRPTTTSCARWPDPPARAQRQRGRARVEGRGGVPAQARPRAEPAGRSASRWRGWPGCRDAVSSGPGPSCARWSSMAAPGARTGPPLGRAGRGGRRRRAARPVRPRRRAARRRPTPPAADGVAAGPAEPELGRRARLLVDPDELSRPCRA